MTKGWLNGLWEYTGADYAGRKVTVTVAYNPANLAIINPGLTGNREAGCILGTVMFGRPDGTEKTFPIPMGNFSVSRTQLSNQGFSTIQQLSDANITLSP